MSLVCFIKSQLNHIFTETKDSNCFIPCSKTEKCVFNSYLPKRIVRYTFYTVIIHVKARDISAVNILFEQVNMPFFNSKSNSFRKQSLINI